MASTDVLTFEKVWELFHETDRRFHETDRRFQETDRIIQKTSREVEKTARIVNKLSKNIGGLNNSLGELMETLVAARLWEKFGVFNLCRAYRRIPIYNEHNKAISEIDILLSNTEWVMAVEVKREVKEYDTDRFTALL